MLDKLVKKYVTPENVMRLAMQVLEQSVVAIVDVVKNAEVDVELEGDSYQVRLRDAKDRYSVDVEGEVREGEVEARIRATVLGTEVEGALTVRGRKAAGLARRALEELSGG